MFVKNKFDNKYNPTIEDSFSKFYTVDNTAVKINILGELNLGKIV